MTETLVTVIVPVYNVEQYLPRCLESIVSQSYSHLEIIVVDDGSTDGCAALCDQWAARDPRIRVIHKPNGGLSDARNAALDVMTGERVIMVDSDDWLHTEAIATLLRLMNDTDADIAVSQWREIKEQASTRSTAQEPAGKCKVYSRQQALQCIFYQREMNHSSCGRLFKASLLDGLRYPVGKLYEDLAVAYALYGRASRVAMTSKPLYYYLQRKSSILGTFTPQRIDVLDILDELQRQVGECEPELLPAVRSRRLSAHFNILLLCPATAQYAHVVERCWNVIRQLRWSCLLDRRVRMKNKLGILASYMGKNVFTRLFRNRYMTD